MKSPMICSIAMVLALVGFGPVARALDQVPNLSLDLARKMAAGCEAKAKEMNWKMNISVVDSGANQIFFEKMTMRSPGTPALDGAREADCRA